MPIKVKIVPNRGPSFKRFFHQSAVMASCPEEVSFVLIPQSDDLSNLPSLGFDCQKLGWSPHVFEQTFHVKLLMDCPPGRGLPKGSYGFAAQVSRDGVSSLGRYWFVGTYSPDTREGWGYIFKEKEYAESPIVMAMLGLTIPDPKN